MDSYECKDFKGIVDATKYKIYRSNGMEKPIVLNKENIAEYITEYLALVGKALDAEDVPKEGRMMYDRETGEIIHG